MPVLSFSRKVVAAVLGIIAVLSSQAMAQSGLPGTVPTASPAAAWYTVGTSDPFPTPDAACRAQHQIYNPNATYQAPVYLAPHAYGCQWLARQFGGPPESNTTLSTNVYISCPNDYSRTSNGECLLEFDSDPECDCLDETQPVGAPPTPIVGNPVSIATGSKISQQVDFETADGLFKVGRTYRSRLHHPFQRSNTPIQGFGSSWHGLIPGRMSVSGYYYEYVEYLSEKGGYDFFVVANQTNRMGYVFNAGGSSRRKLEAVTTPTVSRDDFFVTQAAVSNGPGEFKLTESDGTYTLYRRAESWSPQDGLRYLVPTERVFPGGYQLFYDYTDDGQYPNKVRDSFGREMLLTWADAKATSFAPGTAGGGSNTITYGTTHKVKVVTEIQLPDATKLIYSYSDTASATRIGRNDRLTRVSRQNALGAELWAQKYLYEDSAYPNALTGIVDQNEQRLSTYTYHPFGLVKSSERAGGVGKVEIDYTYTIAWPWKTVHRAVKNPLGRQENYTFARYYYNAPGNVQNIITRIAGLATSTVPADEQTYIHDSPWWSSHVRIVNSVTDRRGVTTRFGNDGDRLRPDWITEAQSTGVARTTNIQWHATLDLPTRMDAPGLRTEMTYGTTGEVLTRTLTDTTTHSLPYATTGQVRTDTYTWGAGGRLTSVNGPRAAVGAVDDITSFTYDIAGNLLTMTNALGHVTTFASYDANGRPGSMTDANGTQTLFTYDALGRLLTNKIKHPSNSALDSTTTYDYDVEGRVTGITSPSTQKLSFVYDLAGQLLEIASADGEKQTFAHDAMGNVTEQKIKRPDNVVRSTITRTFDSIGRMLTETLGPGRTTSWEYDKNGNPVRTTSPRSHATDMAFDALNRLTSTVAPDTGATATVYNAKDEPTRFTDAVAVQTAFVRNGFGEIIQEVSPDRGTSVYHYDAAGDLAAAIDGRGQRIDYTRDILGRVTAKTPVSRPSSETVTYSYDSGGVSGCACVGRLASMTDASGTTNFGYDHRGNLIAKVLPIGALGWSYDLADRIVQASYPSGREVAYARDTKGRVIEVKTRPGSSGAWTTLATNMTYEPFGPLKSADYGNGLKLSQDWGSDRRLASKRLYTASGTDVWHLSYGYDGDDNISSITDNVTPANSRSFGYDSVGRLARVDGGTGGFAREDYVHDKNGNLTTVERRVSISDASPSQSDVHARTSGTNRIASVTHPGGVRGFTHDARGNLTADTRPAGAGVTLGYDGHARLASYARAGAETQAMLYNGFDERVVLTTTLSGSPVEERRYAYDSGHRIVGEYGATTADLRAEYIWLQPEVADASSFGGDDGIGGYMPLAFAVPDGATSKVHWVQGNHLGTPVVTTDASATLIAPTSYARIGFPGQVEQHAELYYNYYRDYDPTTGRYIQADPIGLRGGASPYSYAGGSPLVAIDPLGLTKINGFDPFFDPGWFAAAKAYPDRPGICSVFAHGSVSHVLLDNVVESFDARYWEGKGFVGKNGIKFRSIDDFAKLILTQCKPNELIQLWSCDTGKDDAGFASQLARVTQRRVRAPTAEVWHSGAKVSPNPSYENPFAPGWVPREGHYWRDFGPDGRPIGGVK